MTARRVIFRLEASDESGLGHIARCSALAHVLVESGWSVVIAASATSRRELLERAGVRLLIIDDGAPFAEQELPSEVQVHDARILRESLERLALQPDWIVLDHYGLGGPWEREVGRPGCRLLVLEDFADRFHDVDLVLTDSTYPESDRDRTLRDSVVVLQGLEYALLDANYAEVDGTSQTRPHNMLAATLAYGATDPSGETERVLRVLADSNHGFRSLHVVIGPTNQRRAQIDELARNVPNSVIHREPPSLAPILHDTDVLFCAGGHGLLEGLASRCACFVTVTSENQKRIVDHLHQLRVVEIVSSSPKPSSAEICASLKDAALKAPDLIARLQQDPVVDHRGAHRVLVEMERLMAEGERQT